MSKFLTGGMVAGAFSMLGAVSVASGYPAFGAFLSDPSTAATVTVVASGIAALVAGGLKGLKA